jgi:hypothetical protein
MAWVWRSLKLIISYFFHYVGVTGLSATPDGANFVLTRDADRPIEDQHL